MDRVAFSLDSQTLDGLELAIEHIKRSDDHPISWKWVVIGMHTALHGAFCIALKRTDGAQLRVGYQEQQTYERWDRERASGEFEYPRFYAGQGEQKHEVEEKIDYFENLFKKTQEAHRMQNHVDSQPLDPTPEQTSSVHFLDRLRGNLLHFSDTTLIEPIPPLLDDLAHCLDVFEFLLMRAHGTNMLLFQEDADCGERLIVELRAEIETRRDRYSMTTNI